jgi:hypothetical protein
MRKIVIVLMAAFVCMRAEAQEPKSLNQRNIDEYIKIIQKFTDDSNNCYHLYISVITGDGRIYNRDAILFEQRKDSVDMNIFYHRKLSFIWFQVLIEKRAEYSEDDHDQISYGNDLKKEHLKITYDKYFDNNPWLGIAAILEGLFNSIGYKL